MQAITSKQAQEKLDTLIEQVNLNAEPTILCNEQGKQAVLMSLDEFNSWQETLYLLSSPANASHLMESIQQAHSGHRWVKELIEP